MLLNPVRVLTLVVLLVGHAVCCNGAYASDVPLPEDPQNTCGTFANGLKYIIHPASNPPAKLSLELYVASGSLNETDEQNGLAHFVEHMAFKGSDHFEPMKLIPLLSHLGMTFGADTNAHTNATETVYKLTMPDNKPETIELALTIFSDYANGLKFSPIQIDSERRVILEEARSRKNAAQRLNKEMLAKMLPGARMVTHDVIGDESLIKTFQQPAFFDYWNTWYRPENMTLIVAGDIDPKAVLAVAKDKLGTFTARAPARPPQAAGIEPFTQPNAIVLTDPEQITAKLSIDCMKPPQGPITTVSDYRRQLVEHLAEWIVNHRIIARIAKGDAPFRNAEVGSQDLLQDAFDVSAEAQGSAKDWHAMLDTLIGEINSAIDHGFTAQEIDLAGRGLLANDQWAVKTESTADSKAIAAKLAALVGTHSPILSAQQRLDLDSNIASTLTEAELHSSFKSNFDTKNYTYVFLLPAPADKAKSDPAKSDSAKGDPENTIDTPTPSEVLSAAAAAWAEKTAPLEQSSETALILPKEPPAGAIASRTNDPQLGVTTVVYQNGVVMHHKQLDSEKDQVSIQITLPGGPIEETADDKGISGLAGQILVHPATHRLTSTQIRDLMVGKNVSVAGAFSFDAMKLGVGGSPADLPAGMQLINVLLTDAVLEPPAVDEWKKAQLDRLHEKQSSAAAQVRDAFADTVEGGDLRLTDLTVQDVNRLDLASAEAWFTRIATHSAIEVAVVGDISADQAIDLIGRYVGSLPKRTGAFDALDSLRKLNRPPGPFAKTIHFEGVTPKAMVEAGYVGCDELNLDRRPLALAGAILTDRMIDRIRVQDNLVYSINCTSIPGQALPGLGLIIASAPTDPQNADRLARTIIEMIKDLANMGPSEAELDTAKNQVANTLSTQMKTSGFWLAQLYELEYHKHHLDELHDIPGVFQTFAIHDIRDVLSKYAVDAGEISLEAIPASKAPSPSTTRQSD